MVAGMPTHEMLYSCDFTCALVKEPSSPMTITASISAFFRCSQAILRPSAVLDSAHQAVLSMMPPN
jgi:hypothetical protein